MSLTMADAARLAVAIGAAIVGVSTIAHLAGAGAGGRVTSVSVEIFGCVTLHKVDQFGQAFGLDMECGPGFPNADYDIVADRFWKS